ncbi:MAG: uroporphyrinogen-III C-methyltransferase [candidate division Zixibacteria bacterium]|nr:uroporphyrinogen-III C-methyltransferase [candidate division Zixibacteria bacterium]
MDDSEKGTVYLIGAGPGDPELITLKGWRIAKSCDVVLYDSLIPDEIIVSLPSSIKKIYVGKRGGRQSIPQDEINEMMVELALDGKNIARLKGSDPIIFGRGGEEAMYLKEHGIRFEIIPGVTSGIAGPTYAGIPCTDRNKASYIMFLTGHKAKEKEFSTIPWDWVAKAKGGTLVLYMAVSEIADIVAELIDSGMPPDTPAATIERATYPTQRSFKSVLKDLPNIVADQCVKAPALFVIGEVVDLQPYLTWFEDKPLFGVRVMVTRAAEQAAETYRMLRDLGAEVLPYPTIEISEHFDEEAWAAFENIRNENRWLVFTSENGVRYFMRKLSYHIGDMRHLAYFSIAAVGEGTARALQKHCIEPDFVPSTATVADLAAEFSQYVDAKGATVVRVRGNLSDNTFEEMAESKGTEVLPLMVYRTSHHRWPMEFKEKLFEYPPDVMLFTSGSTFEGLFANLNDDEVKRLTSTAKIFSIGPSTSEKIRQRGFEVTAESTPHTIPALIETLVDYMSEV